MISAPRNYVKKRLERKEVSRKEKEKKRLEKSKTANRNLKKRALKKAKQKPQNNFQNLERKKEEYDAMKKYWDSKADEMGGCFCEESKKYIPQFHIGNVHHIATKLSLPQAACDLENMCILTSEMHTLAHSAQYKMKLYEYFKKVIIKIKRKYSQFGDLDVLENKNKVA